MKAALLVALLGIGAAVAIGCSGPDPKEAAYVDDEIASIGTTAKVGMSVQDILDIDAMIAPLGSDVVAKVNARLVRGLRTDAEVARITSDVAKLQRRWKTSR